MQTRKGLLLALLVAAYHVQGKDSDDEFPDSEERDLESGERMGAAVTQIYRHPYSAALLNNDTYVCSAVLLNTYWLLTLSRCFEPDVISSYVTHRKLSNYTVRMGSSYNNKGGSIHKIKMLINNFDLKVSAVKLDEPIELGPRVQAVRLPSPDEEINLGYLASMVAWTPNGHMRIVNAPVIEASICETYTKLVPGHYICVGGVQDPNRHFCRKDNGGAVIQNDTLIAVTSFLHTCALYTKTHGFPKVSSFSRWLDSVIWDEETRPTSLEPLTASSHTMQPVFNNTETTTSNRNYFADPRKFMLTLPFDPINVPLEPAEDNSVIPRMSLYESYLQNLARAKTSTTPDPNVVEEEKAEWLRKFGKNLALAPGAFGKKYDPFEYK